MKKKNVIVFGIGITGISAIKALKKLNYNIYIYDDRDKTKILEEINDIDLDDITIIDKIDDIVWSNIEFLLKSPGIKNTHKLILEARNNKIDVISDIELAYRIFGGDRFIAVTGTNGKTTITALITHILKNNNIKAKSAGNIGVGILYDIFNEDEDTVYVVEMSSFQLDATKYFRPKIAIISNIFEDHIDWHGSFDDYKKSKFNIFKNQNKDDLLILNQDDNELKDIKCNSRIKFFSNKNSSDIFVKDNKIIFNGHELNITDIKLVGKHNLANIIASILASYEYVDDIDLIFNSIKKFNSIEHRIEFVYSENDIKYYNDSKGTNIDSTKVALNSFSEDIILIAGGYDKNSEFNALFDDVNNIKSLILFGQTKDKLEFAARKNNINNIYKFDSLEDCVLKSIEIANSKDIVLFSPACASWDMYKNFEERGKHFKKIVLDYYEKKENK